MEKEKTYYITNADKIISERLPEAEKILQSYLKKHRRVFIGGSFLFSEKYGDIDIFIITERGYKEEHESGHHLIYLTMKRLQNPVFQSAAKISVSSFLIPAVLRRKPLKLHELMSSYHEAIIEILDKKKRTVLERHRHRYEVNPKYVDLLEKNGIVFSGYYERFDKTKLMEYIEMPGQFMIGTQAHPEFKSRLGNPSPMFYGFVKACGK